MSAPERQALWAELQRAGLVEGPPEGEMPPPDAVETPWAVRLMLGCSGWLGASFLLAFLGAIFSALFDAAAVSIAVGAAMCAGVGYLLHRMPRNGFLDQVALALSLAGQVLIATGLATLLSWEDHAALLALAVAGVQAVLFFGVPHFVHRVWTAGTSALALALALDVWRLYAWVPAVLTLAFAWVWLGELEVRGRSGERVRAGGYGLTFAALAMAVAQGEFGLARLWLPEARPFGGALGVRLGGALAGAVLLWVVYRLLAREGVPAGSGPGRAGLASAAVLALAAVEAPGLVPPVAALILGFANGNRVLTGLGIAALLACLSRYYYQLEATLLEEVGPAGRPGCRPAAGALRPGPPVAGVRRSRDQGGSSCVKPSRSSPGWESWSSPTCRSKGGSGCWPKAAWCCWSSRPSIRDR